MAHLLQPDPQNSPIFFTVSLQQPGRDLLILEIETLRQAVRLTRAERPFHIHAWVVMPDHLHTIWTLPDADYAARWRLIKARFSAGLSKSTRLSVGAGQGIWQRRQWQHPIRDRADYDLHMRACQMDPVRHGLVDEPGDWPYSSFQTRQAWQLAG
jgi:putative transposase